MAYSTIELIISNTEVTALISESIAIELLQLAHFITNFDIVNHVIYSTSNQDYRWVNYQLNYTRIYQYNIG